MVTNSIFNTTAKRPMVRATAETVEVLRAQREAELEEHGEREKQALRSSSRWSRNRKHSLPTQAEKNASKQEKRESEVRNARRLLQIMCDIADD